MKRITPQMVREAYAKTGLIPVRHSFYDHGPRCDHDTRCGCPGTAVAIAHNPALLDEFEEDYQNDTGAQFELVDLELDRMDNRVGHPGEGYLSGFIQGIDGTAAFIGTGGIIDDWAWSIQHLPGFALGYGDAIAIRQEIDLPTFSKLAA